MIRRHARLAVLVSVIMLLAPLLPAGVQAASADDQEIKVGRQASAQIDRRYKLVKDPAIVDRVTRVGLTIAAVTSRPNLPWTYKVLELDQVNAVALPGGFVYVTTGMLKFVRSDHELAAILAHESAHAVLGHGMIMMRRANQAMWMTILIAIATRDPTLFQGANLISVGVLSGYTRDLEREADLTGLDYMTRTSYAPVATLTTLEHIYRLEQLSPQTDAGALEDHPKTIERIQYVTAELQRRQISLSRRPAANYLALSVRQGQDGGASYSEILVNNRAIIRLTDPARIKEAADLLDRLFDADLEPFEVAARETQDGWGVFARGWPILRLTARDVPPGAGNVRDLAATVAARLRAVIDDDIRRRRMDG